MFCRRARVLPSKNGKNSKCELPCGPRVGPHLTPKLRADVVYSCRFFCGLGQRVEACLSTPVFPHKQK